mgnify:CR=1 FL=1
MKSHIIASSQPPPSANPATATGFVLDVCDGDVAWALACAEQIDDAWVLGVRVYLRQIADEERGLRPRERLDAGTGEVEERVEVAARERFPLGGPLHLDETTGTGHHDVAVHLGPGVLLVGEIEDGVTADDADGDGRHGIPEQIAGNLPRLGERAEGERERHVARGDRRAPRAGVGLEDVAVDGDRAFAEAPQVDDRAERTPDEPLDLLRAAGGTPLRHLARRALGGRAREHRVLRRHPPASGSAEPAGGVLVDGG